MAGTIKPRDAKELRQAVEWALNESQTLDVRGQGSKLALGKPMAATRCSTFRACRASSTTHPRSWS